MQHLTRNLSQHRPVLSELSDRSREIFRLIVDTYFETGEPVGSRTLSRRLGQLSPATIRNVMADLEELGLLFAPHTSAGRLPTNLGLRLFVDGLMELGGLTDAERAAIDGQRQATGRSMPEVMEQASTMLSGLSHAAGMVVAPKSERPLKHIEFVHLAPGRALVVLVTEGGMVENRVIDVPVGLPPSTLITASNFLNAKLVGKTLDEAKQVIAAEIEASRAELDGLSKKLIEAGLASWAGDKQGGGALIIRGQSKLLEDVTAMTDLERLRTLFEALETKESLVRLLEATRQGE